VSLEAKRKQAGQRFYDHLTGILATDQGVDFHGGNRYRIKAGKITLGLRVCAMRLDCGFDNERLLSSINAKIASHLIPWECKYTPSSYPDGRYAVIEAVWPEGLERDDIPLSSLDIPALSGERLVVGKAQAGETITLPSHHIEHLLVAGQTGSGKSWALRSLTTQLMHPCKGLNNRLVLIDGKGGEGLGILGGVRGQVGPLALDARNTVAALGWCVNEMEKRYDAIRQNGGFSLNGDFPHVFVVFDEFQRYTRDGNNPLVVELMNRLATQGRAAHMHLIAGTQKPLVGVWGDSTTPDQFSAAIGGRVKDWHASKAIMGDTTPRCDMLLPKGDMYVKAVVPDLVVERVQVAYVPETELAQMGGGQPDLDVWPEYDTENLSRDPGRPQKQPTAEEIAVGLIAVAQDNKRHWYRKQLESPPGAERTDRIIEQCVDIMAALRSRGASLGVTTRKGMSV